MVDLPQVPPSIRPSVDPHIPRLLDPSVPTVRDVLLGDGGRVKPAPHIQDIWAAGKVGLNLPNAEWFHRAMMTASEKCRTVTWLVCVISSGVGGGGHRSSLLLWIVGGAGEVVVNRLVL